MKPQRRNLLIVRAGEESLHPRWVRGNRERNFDLMVSYYGAQPDRYRREADHYHSMKGPRWPAHYAICRDQADLIAQYDYIGFACDDLEADLATWNKLFEYSKRYELDLASPALAGHVSWPITKPHRGCVVRFTNFVDLLCPVFSQRAIQTVAPTFGESVSGWGLSIAWWSHLKTERGIAIIDKVRVRHGRRVGEGTLYSVLSSIGISARDELRGLKDKYDKDYTQVEFSRVMTPLHGTLRKMCPWPYR